MSDVGLGATLQLEITDALARIEQVGASLAAATSGIPVTLDQPDAAPITASIDDAVAAADTTVTPDAQSDGVTTSIDDAIGAADTTIPVDADITAAASEIDSLSAVSDVIVPVDADTTAADASIADVVAVADAETATITVDADTSAADAAISATGDSASNASGGVDQLTSSLGALKGSTADATGLAAGLGSAVGSLPGPFGEAAAAGGALIGIIGGFFEAGTSLIAAEQRLTLTTGEFRQAIEQIDVGSLRTDIKGLAADTGSTIVPIDNAISRIFQLGTSSGETGQQITSTSAKIVALAGFVRASNPALGETGDIANRLTDSLARGGRALQQYGLSLAAKDILEKAQQETGRQTVTQYEKTAAAADLLSEKLGPEFAARIAAGTENPVIQIGQIKAEFTALFEEIGKPVVAPVVSILRDLAPLGEEVGRTLGVAVEAVLPFAEDLGIVAKQAAPVLDVLIAVAAPLIKLAALLNPINVALRVGDAAFSHIIGPIESLGGALERLASGPVGKVESVLSGVISFAEGVGEKVSAIAGKVEDFLGGGGTSEDKFTAAVKDATKAADDQAVSTIKAAAADGTLTEAQANAALGAKDHTAALAALQPELDAHAVAVAEAASAYGPLFASADKGVGALTAVGAESATAGNAISALAASGINPTSDALLTFAQSLNSADLSAVGLDNTAIALGVTTAQLSAFLSGVSSAIAGFVSKVDAGIPSIGDAFKPVTASAKSAGGAMANTAQTALQTQRSIESAQHGIEIANRGVADSADALVKANQGVQTSVENLTKAQQNLQDAEQALADSRNPAKPKDVEQANINLERAQLNVTKATDSVTKAENDLNNARAGVGTISVHDAEIALQDARLSAEESTIRVSDAEDALNTVRQVGTEADKNVTSAEKAVATAHDQVTSAADGVVAAQHQVELANRAVADSAYAAKSAQEALTLALNKPAPSGGGGGAAVKEAQVSLDEFVNNLQSSTTKTKKFFDELRQIIATGAVELAGQLAQAGPAQAGKIVDTLAKSIGPGNKSPLVTYAEQAVEASNTEYNAENDFLTSTFGPAFALANGDVARAGTAAFGSNFNPAAKIAIAAQVASGQLSTDGAHIALIAATAGDQAATNYGKNIAHLDDATIAAGLAAAHSLQTTDLSGPAATAAASATGPYGAALIDPKTGLPAVTVAALNAAGHALEDPNGLGVLRTGSKSAGDVSLQGFVEGIHPIPEHAASTIANAIPGVDAPSVVNAIFDATKAGKFIGEAFSAGLAQGIADPKSSHLIDSASRAIVDYAEKQAREQAQSHSPSLVWAEIGHDLAAGLGVGLSSDEAQAFASAGVKKLLDGTLVTATAAIADELGGLGVAPASTIFRGALASPAVTTTASTFGSRQNQANGAAQIQVAVGPFSFDSGTTTEQAAALVRSATDSAVDAVRRRSAVFVAVQTAGQR